MICICSHITADYCDIPVVVSFFPHQSADLLCSQLCLHIRTARCIHRKMICFIRILFSGIAEQLRFQKAKLRIAAKPVNRLVIQINWIGNFYFSLSRNLYQTRHHLLTECKQLIRMRIPKLILPSIHLNCY